MVVAVTRLTLIEADWPAPSPVRAFCTSREGGFSKGDFGSANMALHVDDNDGDVAANRAALARALPSGTELHWLEQVHGLDVLPARAHSGAAPATGDGWYCDVPLQALIIMSADCLPLLLCNRAGSEIAALHAGWRGVAGNILAHGVARFNSPPDQLLLWIGPGISAAHFTVGDDVREQLANSVADADSTDCFSKTRADGRSTADLATLVRLQAQALGVGSVYGGQSCSFSQPEQFYSYRRAQRTGRNATVIVLGE